MSENDFSNAAFQNYLSEHKLMGVRCQSCQALFLPPRPVCADCFSVDMSWEEISQEGELAAFTVIHIAPTAMIEAGYGRDNPYCSGIVKLLDGPSISAQILGVDISHPETIRIGTPLKAEFLERQDGEQIKTFLAFQVVE
ncbi:MAG: Zn-ribbon domain-containing OB-fold protein [Anaerolineales bacterium]